MRKLTQQEIDNAPEWATHYSVDTQGLMYESAKYYLHPHRKCKDEQPPSCLRYAKPIPRKELAATMYDRACLDIFNDFDSSEVMKMAPSIVKAWEAGQKLKGKL